MDQKNAPNVIKNTCSNDENLIMFFFLKPFFKIIFHQLNNFFTKFVFKIFIENFASILIFESLIL